jgi:hypothetical protein
MSDPAAVLRARAADLDALLARLDADGDAVRADRADQTADDEHDPEGRRSRVNGSASRRCGAPRHPSGRRWMPRSSASLRDLRCLRRVRPCDPAARLEARPFATTCVGCA